MTILLKPAKKTRQYSKLRLLVSLIDGVSGPASKAGKALNSLRQQSSWSSIGGAMAGAGAAVGGQLTKTRSAFGAFQESLMGPAGIAAGFAAITQGHTYVKFTENLNRIKAATGASVADMEALKRKIFEVSAAHGQGYDDVSEGALALIKSGKDIHETIGALDAVTGASVAVERSVEKTAGTLTDVVYGMGLRVTNQQDAMEVFGQVADVATAASYKFNQSYDGMIEGLAKGAPMARIAGLSLIDITTMLGVMADEGFKGEEGGTAFASSLLRMMNPSKKANAELKAAGLNLKQFTKHTGEAQLGARQLTDALEEEAGIDASRLIPQLDAIMKDPRYKENAALLSQKLQAELASGLGMDANSPNIDKVKDGINSFLGAAFTKVDVKGMLKYLAGQHADENMPLMKELFGVNQAPKMVALINAYRSELYDKQHKLLEEQAQGAVSRHAAENMKQLSGSLRHLGSAWKLLGGMIFDVGGAGKNLTFVFNKCADALTAFAQSSPEVLKLAGYLGTAFAAAAPLGLALSALSIPLRGLRFLASAAMLPVTALGAGMRVGTAASIALGSGLLGLGRAASAATMLFGTAGGIRAIGAAALAALNPLRMLRGALSVFAVGTPIGLGLTAIAAAGAFIYENWKGLGEFFSAFGKAFMEALPPSIADGFQKLGGYLSDIAGSLSIGIGRWREWGAAAGRAGGAVARFITNNTLTRALGISSAPAAPAIAGAKASGGPVSSGKSYLVGELGPEIFTPSRPGSITANGKIGGRPIQVTNNITIQSTGDIASMAREVERQLSRALRRAIDGSFGDIGPALA